MFPEESILGNQLEVNVRVGTHDRKVVTLEDSIDYTILLEMVESAFRQPVILLETAAQHWTKEVKARFPKILYSKISVLKLNPPLPTRVEQAEITIEKYYEE